MHGDISAVEARTGRLARFAAALRASLGLAVDLALPQLCPACREPVGDAGLCAGCWSKLSFIAPPYGDRLDLAPTMGRWMANAGRQLLADTDAIVPVPLHWRRQWARRFNQSALLGEIIAKASARPVLYGALKRVKATPQQV